MKLTACFIALAALAAGGCRTNTVIAVAEPQWRFSDSATAMWRFRLDGAAYVFIGGIPGSATDVKKVTAFFLIPADAFDAKTLVLRLEPDGASINVGGVAFAGPRESAISEPRIFRFIERPDRQWELQALSAPLPPTVTRAEMLRLLSSSLNRTIIEKPNQALQPTPTAGTSAAEPPVVPAAVVADL